MNSRRHAPWFAPLPPAPQPTTLLGRVFHSAERYGHEKGTHRTLESTAAITFLYSHDLIAAVTFYEDTFSLGLVDDRDWTRAYRTHGAAYLGVVAKD